MVRIAGQNPTMENREELLDALNDFSRKQPKEIPPLLEQFLKQVAKTGETLFPWTLLKALFVTKLEQVMHDFNEECINDDVPPCPNVENARFEVYRSRIMEAVHRFHGAPFTIQRLCELLTDPKRHYKRCDKFMRGLEKNVLVVSTVDPFGRKVVSESKNLVNGMDSNNSSSEEPSAPATTSSLTSTTPPVPSWPCPSSSSSPTTTWPVQADLITPSTAPLLEVCDLPDPKDGPLSSPSNTTPTSTESSAINGHDELTSGSGSLETAADSAGVAGTPTTDLPVVTSMEETVDSSDQQVAAEEMVGVEEETAVSTGISQEAAGVVEETVVETPPVAAEVMKESTDLAESGGSGEVTSAASGDWLATITDQTAKSDSSTTESQDESGEPKDTLSAESKDTAGAGLQDGSVSDCQDSSCPESGEGSEPQPSGDGGDSSVTVKDKLDSSEAQPSEENQPADSSEAQPSEENQPADSSVQPDSECSEDKASGQEGEDEGHVEESNREDSGDAKKVDAGEEVSNEAGCAHDDKGAESRDTMLTASVTTESSVTNISSACSTTSSEAEVQLPSDSPVPDCENAEANMTPASDEVSTSQKVSPSSCTSATADAETTNSSASSDAVTTTTATTTSCSPKATSFSATEDKSEDVDTNSTQMETDSVDSSTNVPQPAECAEPETAASNNGSTEVQEEVPSVDSSQAEPMEQD